MRAKKFASLAGILLLFTWLTANLIRAQDESCKDAATTAAMRACENTRYQKSEQALNAEYGRVMKQLDPSRQEKLRQAQRAWVAFRDANADFLAGAALGGTLAPLIRVIALADMTQARTTELQKLGKH